MARITWTDSIIGEKAQFIADTFNECLFDYSFDSNKVPSLNLHFFCKDYIATYLLVKEGIMQDGNMIPLNEELEYIIQSSPWLPTGISNDLFFFKNNQGRFFNVSTDKNVSQEKKTDYYYSIAKQIDDFFSSSNSYCKSIVDQINTLLDAPTFSISEKRVLYFCVREYICELINLGLSKQHLFNRVQNDLFTNKGVDNGKKYIIDFLLSVIPNNEKYVVVFGISDDVYKELNGVIKKIRESSQYENEKLSSKYVVESTTIAIDPVSALFQAKEYFSAIISIYNATLHSSEISLLDNGLVRKESSKTYKLINDKRNLLKKLPTKRKEERDKVLKTVASAGLNANLLSAFELHNNALGLSDVQSQLLSLWSIFELLIETKQNFMNRVNYVSNAVISVLNSNYYRRLFENLYQQIKITRGINAIINAEPRGDSATEKLLYILKDNNSLLVQIKEKLERFPLERYKLDFYSELFTDAKLIHQDLIRHSNRLRWQIMRIYRNRCMIVHDGNSMPYLEFITENLHYYIDEVLECIITYMNLGNKKNDTAFNAARVKEAHSIRILEKVVSEKRAITDDELRKVLFT
jgi:hypothetical protein